MSQLNLPLRRVFVGALPLRAAALLLALQLAAPNAEAQGAPTRGAPNVEFEMMTWPEVKQALADGKTTALFYTGGTEQRGPQNVNGGHNLMGRIIVRSIAQGLGNAIAMPVLPYTPNNASAALPGTIGLTPDLLSAILERVSEQAIATGFKNVVLMGDHGGGQPNVYADVAKKLTEKYAAQGFKVVYCDDVYAKAHDDLGAWLEKQQLPGGGHASIIDTSEMLYLGGDAWVRLKELPNAEGDPILPRGQRPDPNVPRKNNGITGDARKSSKELGKKIFDTKVDYAVRQIRTLLAP
ncbi:MAG TPA: creatininase family protein [Gemmatimonas sp.]|uniref:creatininase family protein n=1 Tax=Gemmatimonas sp. TaxID=1962908 RepID=UPI002ED868D3